MAKKRTKKLDQVASGCFETHEFMQVSESHDYAIQTLGQIPLKTSASKPPRFICRKCGKVIQL